MIPWSCIIVTAILGYVLSILNVPYAFLLTGIIVAFWVSKCTKSKVSNSFFLPFVQIVLGMSTGVSFRVESWDVELLTSIVCMVICLLLGYSFSYLWLVRKSKWEKLDAALAIYPGALAVVLDVLQMKSVRPRVMLIQLTRLLFLTLLLSVTPFMEASVNGNEEGDSVHYLGNSSHVLWNWDDAYYLLVFIVVALLSWGIGRFLLKRVPASYLLSATIVSAFVSQQVVVHGIHVPEGIVTFSTILLGLLIGELFKNIAWQDFVVGIKDSLWVFGMSLLTTILMSQLASILLGIPFMAIFLAYVPGAVETVSVVALLSGLDMVFILTHHLIRMIILQILPLFFLKFYKSS